MHCLFESPDETRAFAERLAKSLIPNIPYEGEGRESGDRYAEAKALHVLQDKRGGPIFTKPNGVRCCVIALYGDLGAGKTTFVQGLVRGLGGDPDLAHSPTFTYMHVYPTKIPLTHFDLYRLRTSDDFLGMGFDEAFDSEGIVAIEWPERIGNLLPPSHLEIRLTHESEDTRKLEMRWN